MVLIVVVVVVVVVVEEEMARGSIADPSRYFQPFLYTLPTDCIVIFCFLVPDTFISNE